MDELKLENISEEEKESIIGKASDVEKQKDFYEKLRLKVDRYIEEHPKAKHINYIMMFPDFFHLTCKLFADERVPAKNKLYLGIAIVYCISPIDILPDLLPYGFTDDAIIIIKTLFDLINSVDNEIICEHWVGAENIVKIINDLADIVDEYLSKGKIVDKVSDFIGKLKK